MVKNTTNIMKQYTISKGWVVRAPIITVIIVQYGYHVKFMYNGASLQYIGVHSTRGFGGAAIRATAFHF